MPRVQLDLVNHQREPRSKRSEGGNVQHAEVSDRAEVHLRHLFCRGTEEEHAAHERRCEERLPVQEVSYEEETPQPPSRRAHSG